MPDSYEPPPPQAIGWVERSLGPRARVQNITRLHGGLTSNIDRLTVRTQAEDVLTVVLRRWPADSAWGEGLIQRESAGLTAIAQHGLPAPRLLGADATGDDAGSASLLMSALPGAPVLQPVDIHNYVTSLAAMLARIHAITVPALDPTDPHGFEPLADRSWLGDRSLADMLVQAASTAPLGESAHLLHGDFQPLNILWRGDKVSGVVDWTYTGRGPQATDVGHCRLALAVLYSAEAAEELLACYEAEIGQSVDPRRDIRALLAYNRDWLDFAQRAVGGRADIDGPGMDRRVTVVLRTAARRLA